MAVRRARLASGAALAGQPRAVERPRTASTSSRTATGVTQVDLYFETDDWRFHRAGYALRIRRVGRRREAEATLKGLDPASADAARTAQPARGERARWRAADLQTLLRAGGPVGARVRAVAGRSRFCRCSRCAPAAARSSSRPRALPPGEIALDETAIRPPGGGPRRACGGSRSRCRRPRCRARAVRRRAARRVRVAARRPEQVRGRASVLRPPALALPSDSARARSIRR